MKFNRYKFFSIIFSIAILAIASTSQASQTNEVLLGAMSPFEDMIESALAGNGTDVSKALTAADQQSKSVKTTLPASAAEKFTALMDVLHKAVRSKNSYKTATYATDIFRLLAENLQVDSLDVPKEVSLLDYTGFKLRVLAASQKTDWRDVRATIGEATGWWKAIRSKVSMKGLSNTFDTLIRGLETSEKTRNVKMLGFAAQMTLDLVDLLESDLKMKP
ncbi:MAG TPA: hypothetical protein PLP18_02285 [Smithellaceae bacterium]|nr:hypothetical protein [Smithellaceae bacterium]